MHKAVRNVTRLFERIQDFEKRVVKRRGALSRADAEALAEALVLLARVLAPFAPHFSEALLLERGPAEEDEVESPLPIGISWSICYTMIRHVDVAGGAQTPATQP